MWSSRDVNNGSYGSRTLGLLLLLAACSGSPETGAITDAASASAAAPGAESGAMWEPAGRERANATTSAALDGAAASGDAGQGTSATAGTTGSAIQAGSAGQGGSAMIGTSAVAQSQAGAAALTQMAEAAGSAAPATAGAPAPTATESDGAAGAESAGTAGDAASEPTHGADPASCDPTEAEADAPVIYVIGDSTASVYARNLYPRMGWAQPLQDYFPTGCATVQDKALSGRSSKSFLEEGAWAPIKRRLRAGDFVLIQFGHNDEKSDDAARYTEPFGSYQKYLGQYIDDTLAADATPILLTSIERNKWRSGRLVSTHGDYPEAVRELAEARQLTLVDMTQITHTYLEHLGQAEATKLFMNLAPGESPNYPNGNSDNTHLQERGARVVAELALSDLAQQRAPIAALLDHVPMP